MALFRSFNEIVNSMRERLRLTQPNLDTKPGTVSRDLFIDMQADQIERFHNGLLLVAEKQNPASAVGEDVDRWASNFGITRKGGSQANGIVVFTTNELNSDIPIPSNTICTAKNGVTYSTVGSFVMSVTDRNRYAANASRLRRLLNIAGITDQYAIEIPVIATTAGLTGNVASFQVTSSNLADGLKLTNLTAFSNGENREKDSSFKARVFAGFSGANTGTSAGYRNAALGVSGVLDALVVEPGNTLMLRDGTETIEIDSGNFRILNSGTGGKVDIYILGNSLTQNFESYIYTDKSGNGDPTDERNNFTPGISFLDNTLTSEERRVQAFKNGQIPLQPVNSIVSLSGSSSGVFTEKFTDSSGNVSGNFELVKDVNVETGGSPFGYDYIKFISNQKLVEGEVIIKQDLNSVDPLRFSDISSISDVYQDRQILSENSTALTDRSVVQLNHKPVVTVSRVANLTTGEVYVISSQNLTDGLNREGQVTISGKTLPIPSDILSVDYVWRNSFDKNIDYNGSKIPQLFSDSSVSDSVDWGIGNGIFEEESIVTQSTDGFEYLVEADYDISRVISVYTKTTSTGTVTTLTNTSGASVSGIELPASSNVIENIISVKTSSGLEVWNTSAADGSFNVRAIYLPSDAPISSGETLSVEYNRVEFFNVVNTDASYATNIITLPSSDILEGLDLLDLVDDLFLTEGAIYIQYVSALESIVPSVSMSSLPITGSDDTDRLSDNTLTALETSNQPIFFELTAGNRTSISKFGPTRLECGVSGIVNPGKIKISGLTLTRMEFDITAGISMSGLAVDIKSQVLSELGLSDLPINLGIARVDSIGSYDVVGTKIKNNEYDLSYSIQDSSLAQLSFVLPSTSTNNSISLSSAETVTISVLIYRENDFETLYFGQDQTVITDKIFGRVDRVTVASGFRSSVGTLSGSISVGSSNQPDTGISYSADYSFVAPKEGERITVRYNTNTLIANATRAIESVRPITADVLVKEAFDIQVDVSGEILIDEDAAESETQILENVTSAVINLLNTGTLGSLIDYSDVINVATSVTGVDSANISLFNETGMVGRKTFIKALDNQTISAGVVLFRAVSRKDFRIT